MLNQNVVLNLCTSMDFFVCLFVYIPDNLTVTQCLWNRSVCHASFIG